MRQAPQRVWSEGEWTCIIVHVLAVAGKVLIGAERGRASKIRDRAWWAAPFLAITASG
jgi:hypothetical protein